MTQGACEICHRDDVPTKNGRLKVHRKDRSDKGSAYCSGVGLEGAPTASPCPVCVYGEPADHTCDAGQQARYELLLRCDRGQ